MATGKGKEMIFARVDPEFRELVKAEAEIRFEGNESLLVRDAVRLYLRLRAKLGAGFEPTIEALAGPVTATADQKEPVAA